MFCDPRSVGAVLSPLESDASTLCDGGSDHTLGGKLSSESATGDTHYIVHAPGQIKLTVQHYQVIVSCRSG